MSKYWLHCSQSAKWNHQSRRQPRTVGFFSPSFFPLWGSNMCPNPRLGPALGPAGALPSAVHISMRVCALESGFSELLLHAARPPQRRVCRSLLLELLAFSRRLQGTDCARLWVCTLFPPPPNAPYVSSDWPCPPQWKLSVDFLRWQVRCDQLGGVERWPQSSGLVAEEVKVCYEALVAAKIEMLRRCGLAGAWNGLFGEQAVMFDSLVWKNWPSKWKLSCYLPQEVVNSALQLPLELCEILNIIIKCG